MSALYITALAVLVLVTSTKRGEMTRDVSRSGMYDFCFRTVPVGNYIRGSDAMFCDNTPYSAHRLARLASSE